MPTEPTLAEITAEIKAKHRNEFGYCGECIAQPSAMWPCDVAILLSTIEKMEKVAEAARVALTHLDETPLESWGLCSVCDRNFNVLRAALEGKRDG